jgi:hypothetical protein
MGEIADSLISGEFDCITGEYLGEAVGYPRTLAYGRHEYMPPVEKKPTSKANVCISNMCKDRGFSNHEKVELVAKFLYSKGYKQLTTKEVAAYVNPVKKITPPTTPG